ncbi:MAG: tRNA pseudouridine(55) synthase TruB [Eubacteriales bacterium]|nr:tRNA pseudouridine(55) synthase TruB [Eubacteriales bacterium]
MNGVLNLIKPPGMTSFDVVRLIKKAVGEKKVGHSGTLDPAASGVLPVFVGRNATKTIGYLDRTEKSYRAVMRLGVETDTMDAEGNVLKLMPAKVNKSDITEAALGFIGEIEQIPPMYSAVKQKGKKLYELARQGLTVERSPRRIMIYKLDIVEFEGDYAILDVKCSSGTYIRTLCSDIGKKLGCGAHLAFLVRTASGPFNIGEAFTLEDAIRKLSIGETGELLLPADYALKSLDRVTISEKNAARFRNGMTIPADGETEPGSKTRVYSCGGELLGVAETLIKDENKYFKPEKIFS